MRNVFILGSCVTRDAFEFVANDYQIAGYFCRTSFGSAFLETPFALPLSDVDVKGELTSSFQRRMVEMDFAKEMKQKLDTLQEGTIIIVDLIDERFQLLKYNGTIATHSAELQKAKPTVMFPEIDIVPAESEEHFEMWKLGVARFYEIIQRKKLRLVLNAVYYSGVDTAGAPFHAPAIERQNLRLTRLYESFIDITSCCVIRYDIPFTADANHKWGRSPFHYDMPVYLHFMQGLDHCLRQEMPQPRDARRMKPRRPRAGAPAAVRLTRSR